MNNKYIETAITFARLYGIAETLQPWEYLENDKFKNIILVGQRNISKMTNRIFSASLKQK